MMYPAIFSPLAFRTLEIKNRVLRSSIAGRFDNYDGSGAQPRINWEVKFARGGVGAIISSFVPVHPRGRILPNYATIHSDDRIPFWRALGEAVHAHDCKYILQLSHGGRQRDIPTIDYPLGLSSTSKRDPLHGFECEAMTLAQIKEAVAAFAEGARRARDAGLDGVELHGANGYLITQFLSSGINDRTDEYGGVLANRARFVREIVQAIRARVGRDFHLQMKISATEFNDALLPDEKPGNTTQDSVQVCQWLTDDGVDAIHVSSGSSFPHPRNPAGDLPVDELLKTYDSLISSGALTLRNYLLFSGTLTSALFKDRWETARGPREHIEGLNRGDARAIKEAVGNVPVICTGGFQTAAIIEDAITRGDCDAVSIARPLIANNDLVQQFARGIGRPANPCTFCNRCLVNAPENPLGCYDESRFPSRDAMVQEILSVYRPQTFQQKQSWPSWGGATMGPLDDVFLERLAAMLASLPQPAEGSDRERSWRTAEGIENWWKEKTGVDAPADLDAALLEGWKDDERFRELRIRPAKYPSSKLWRMWGHECVVGCRNRDDIAQHRRTPPSQFEALACPPGAELVFLSHSLLDLDFALRLRRDLAEHGLCPWLAEERIAENEPIFESVRSALERSRLTIVALGRNALGSAWVHTEAVGSGSRCQLFVCDGTDRELMDLLASWRPPERYDEVNYDERLLEPLEAAYRRAWKARKPVQATLERSVGGILVWKQRPEKFGITAKTLLFALKDGNPCVHPSRPPLWQGHAELLDFERRIDLLQVKLRGERP